MKPVVAVIAPGNMGAGVGGRLAEYGVTVLTALAGRSAASAERAAKAGMKAASDAEIAGADIILSIVPPAEAEALATRLRPALKAARRKPLYIDCNAVNPETVARIAAIVAEAACPFADAGIIGGPPKAGASGPKFYVSGAESKAATVLSDYGLQIRAMGGSVGDASAMKMCYGAFNKGLVALGSAIALAAGRNGVADTFRAELAESQAPMLAQLMRTVPDMFPKAYRWVAEFDEVGDFVGSGPEGQIFHGIARLYEAIAADAEGPRRDIAALADFFATRPDKRP